MKNTLLIAILSIFSLAAFAQNEGPIKFLGIPIDGTEAQFATKLKAKGFRYNSLYESYKGQFNGRTVDVYLHTNHDIVDRVYVSFPATTEENVRQEYNQLLSQFNNTGKYADWSFNEEIPAKEDISYEMTVNNKRYQASFSYYDDNRDPYEAMEALVEIFKDYVSDEQKEIFKKYLAEALDKPKEEVKAIRDRMMAELQEKGFAQETDAEPDPEKAMAFLVKFLDGMKSLADGEVWFMIHEKYGRYYIGLYYDNLHNQAHGEDL